MERPDAWHQTDRLDAEQGKGDPFAAAVRATRMSMIITNPRLAEQIAKESGAKIGGRLYSDALSAADGPAGTYIAMMKHNISQIEKALVAGPA